MQGCAYTYMYVAYTYIHASDDVQNEPGRVNSLLPNQTDMADSVLTCLVSTTGLRLRKPSIGHAAHRHRREVCG